MKAIESNAGSDGLNGEDGARDDRRGERDRGDRGRHHERPGATSLWGLGFNGQGIVVANQDTGMRWTHAALRTHYRGWSGGTPPPTTTTTGTTRFTPASRMRTAARVRPRQLVRLQPGRSLRRPGPRHPHHRHDGRRRRRRGSAPARTRSASRPGAKWIGCRNMDAGNGTRRHLHRVLPVLPRADRPRRANADPTKRPHVMNNSWGCPLAGELLRRATSCRRSSTTPRRRASSSWPRPATTARPAARCRIRRRIYASAFSTGAISGTTNALRASAAAGR